MTLPNREQERPHTSTTHKRELQHHPDKSWIFNLLQSIQLGVTLGYEGPRGPMEARNLLSAHTHPTVVDDEIQRECQAGRLLDPFQERPLPNLKCSGVGVVPKKNGKWCMIHHLSAPPGSSVNDHIPKEPYSLQYSSVPYLFNQFADALEWILRNDYGLQWVIHYLDDYLIHGPPNNNLCRQFLQDFLRVCTLLGIPVATEKVEGPLTILTFLGLELDSIRQLTQDRLAEKSEEGYKERAPVPDREIGLCSKSSTGRSTLSASSNPTQYKG